MKKIISIVHHEKTETTEYRINMSVLKNILFYILDKSVPFIIFILLIKLLGWTLL